MLNKKAKLPQWSGKIYNFLYHKKNWWQIVALFAVVLALNAWSLMRYPAPFADEAWFGSRAWAFLHTGYNAGPLDAGVFDRFEGYWTIFPWLPTLFQAFALSFANTPTLLPLRIMSLLWGLILLIAVYVTANSLHGRRFAMLSVFIVGTSTPFLFSAHWARIDIMAAALGFVAIALYFTNRSTRFWKGLLSGLCVGLSFEIHAHAAVFAPAIAALYFWDWRWSMLRKRHFWGYIAGGLLGGAIYAAIHILPYPQTYVQVNQLAFSATHIPPLLTWSLPVILEAIVDMGILLVAIYPVLIILLVLSIVTLVRSGDRPNQHLLVLGLAMLLGFILLVRNKSGHYAILLMPITDMMLAALLLQTLRKQRLDAVPEYIARVSLWTVCAAAIAFKFSLLWTAALFGMWVLIILNRNLVKTRRLFFLLYAALLVGLVLLIYNYIHSYTILLLPAIDLIIADLANRLAKQPIQQARDYVTVAVVWCLFAGGVAINLNAFRTDLQKDYQLTQNQINQVVQPGDSIMGAQTYWFGLYDHTYYSWEELVYYQRFAQNSSLENAFSEFRPDLFIIDHHVARWIIDEEASTSTYTQHIKLSHTEMKVFLHDHAELVADFDGGIYGPVQVYRIHW